MDYSSYKSLAVANYILDLAKKNNDTLTPMQLIKLTYIAHGWMLGKYGVALLLEPVQAWQYGPVVASVYKAVSKYRSSPVENVEGYSPFAPIDFSDREKEIMEKVYNIYGKCDGLVLSSATHQPESPWSSVPSKRFPASTISNDLIEHFYKNHVVDQPHSAL